MSRAFYIDTPYNNPMVKLAGISAVICLTAIIYNRKRNPAPHKENERNKRYVIKSRSHLNKTIDANNRASGHIKHNWFSNRNRLKRFHKV